MIEGTATGMGMGGELNPYVRFPDQSGFTQGTATISARSQCRINEGCSLSTLTEDLRSKTFTLR